MRFGPFCLKKFISKQKSLKSIGFEAFQWQREAGGAALPVAEEAAAPAPQPRLWRAVAEQARERQRGKACSTAKKGAVFQQPLWQREKDSNPHIRSQSPLCYLYTIPLNAWLLYMLFLICQAFFLRCLARLSRGFYEKQASASVR